MPYGIGFSYMIIVQIIFFIVTLGLILWFVKNNRTMNEENESPKDILDKRLAKGDISMQEYNTLINKIK